MSRFRNLEFDEEPSRHENDGLSSQQPIKDEAYHLAEARRAFEIADFELGLRLYARALEENTGSTAAWTGQVRMLIELREFHEAKAWADKALESHPNHAELLAAKAVALARLGEIDEALAFSDASFEERGNTPYVWLARADVLLSRNEHRAEYCFEKALALAPHEWFFQWLAARVRMFHKQFAQALKALRAAIDIDASRFILWLHRGECELALGSASVARVSFRQALELNPLCDAARSGLRKAEGSGLLDRFAGLWRRLTRS